MRLSLLKHRMFKCPALTFLSLPMPTYWKHCLGETSESKHIFTPFGRRTGSIWLTNAVAQRILHFWSGWNCQGQGRGFWGGSGPERQTLHVYRCHITWAFTCLDHMATLAQNRTPTQDNVESHEVSRSSLQTLACSFFASGCSSGFRATW